MLSILLRHYRRFAVFSGGMAVLGTIGKSVAGYDVSFAGYFGIFALAFVAGILAAIVIYAIAPRYRGFLEFTGAAAFLTAIVIYIFSGILTGLIPVLITAIALSAAFIVLMRHALYGKLSRKIGSQTTWRDRHSGHIPYPARLVWRHVIPGAAEPSDHCTGLMARYDEDTEDEDTVHVTFKGRKDRQAAYSLTFLERDPPESCRFFFQGTEADGTPVDGIFSLRITVLERDACFISLVEERAGLCLGSLVECWFDDRLGFQHDKLLEKLDGLYGETYGPNSQLAINAD